MKKTLDKSTLGVEIELSTKPVVVSFYSLDCKPCNLMKPDLDELEKEYGERLRVVRVDVNEHKEFAERFSVVSTPTIVMFSGGKPALRVLGYATRLDLKQKIEELLKNAD